MQYKFIRKSCPDCGAPLAPRAPTGTDRPTDLYCHTNGCGYTEPIPIDVTMRLNGAPELPGF